MIKSLFISLIGLLLLTGCYFGDNPEGHTTYLPNQEGEKKFLPGNCSLYWLDDFENQQIVHGGLPGRYGSEIIIDRSVYAIGYDSIYIIAKQHPYIADSIENSIYGEDENTKGHHEIKKLKDTIYLQKEDSIYQENGKWYHNGESYEIPDSLKPDKRISYFYIIDTKRPNPNMHTFYTLYTFDNEESFNKKRLEIGVPKNLSFQTIEK